MCTDIQITQYKQKIIKLLKNELSMIYYGTCFDLDAELVFMLSQVSGQA